MRPQILCLATSLLLNSCVIGTRSTAKKDIDSIEIRSIALSNFNHNDWSLCKQFTKGIERTLINKGYNVVDRHQFNRILAEYRLDHAGITNQDNREFGEIQGVDAIVTGSISRDSPQNLNQIKSASIHMTSIRTGEIILTASFENCIFCPFYYSGNAMAVRLLRKLPSNY